MANYYTNGDKILQAVLADSGLAEWGDYTPTGEETIAQALYSSNVIVRTVAMIIDGNESHLSEKDIYKQVSNYLIQNL